MYSFLYFLKVLTKENNNDIICKDKKERTKKMNKLYNNLSIENLIKTDWFEQFKFYQKEEILEGLKDNLDVSIYANPEYK